MDPRFDSTVYAEEEQSDAWVLFQETLRFEKTRQQIEACDTSTTQKPAIIIDNEALSDLAFEPTQTNSYLPTVGVVLHSVESSDANPTSDAKVVDSADDSTASGLTFSTPEDVSSNQKSGPPSEDDCPSQPLTQANLWLSNTPGLVRDIQVWINGNPRWLRDPVSCDQASDGPFARATTRHSSSGSLYSVLLPDQPPSVGRDTFAVGTWDEQPPLTNAYSSDMELDED